MNSKVIEPILNGFLSNHESQKKIVNIRIEPNPVYFEDSRDSINLNFDFIIDNLIDSKVRIKFIKVAVYDDSDKLVTFRHLNHNGVGTPSIHTIGKFELDGKETIDVFNPFHRFPKDYPINHLRYMFTVLDVDENKEYYYGNVIVRPEYYEQKVSLTLPIKGLLTVLDGHDFYSHHRRFGMSIVRRMTENKFRSNFSRYGLDFTVVGNDGNTRKMKPVEYAQNYDFHFEDARTFYTDNVDVIAPADGKVVAVVNDLDDLYKTQFDMDNAIREDRISELAGNYVTIQHNEKEFSHLFHLKRDSISVTVGEFITKGQIIGKIGFSGASTTYSHLHYQLMDGPEFLVDNPLPCKFSDITIVKGSVKKRYDESVIDTGDFIYSE